MLEELRESFQAMLEEKGERLILDEYLPKNGTYRLLFLTESGYWIGDTLEIQYDRKEGKIAGSESKYYDLICYLDYWSKLIDMNKPVDSKKVIHSNQYLSFFVKKDSISGEKLTDEVINGYFDVLKSPEKKYKKGKTRELYGSVKEKLGEVDSELLERIRKIVLERQVFDGIDSSKKDYCKLFFVWENEDKTRAVYQQEGLRYLLPNLYNSNDFNRKQDGKILGLPNNNMGMNSKKPYLHHYSRKVTVPYLLDQDEALLQMQLFDYLSGFAAKDKVNVYVCPDDEIRIKAVRDTEESPAVSGGYYLRLKKGKKWKYMIGTLSAIMNWSLNGYFD